MRNVIVIPEGDKSHYPFKLLLNIGDAFFAPLSRVKPATLVEVVRQVNAKADPKFFIIWQDDGHLVVRSR